jgi:hypothetical protein
MTAAPSVPSVACARVDLIAILLAAEEKQTASQT